jgi:hypothetical protein
VENSHRAVNGRILKERQEGRHVPPGIGGLSCVSVPGPASSSQRLDSAIRVQLLAGPGTRPALESTKALIRWLQGLT